MGDDTGNTGDSGGQAPATTGDGRRLTYAELAARLGISGEAARILVRRRGWQRIMPNHPRGLTVVVVPDDALADEDWRRVAPTVPDAPATEGDTEGGQAVQPATGGHLMASALAALETALTSLTERALAAERRADGADARADQAEAGRDNERARADDMRDRLIAMQEQLADAHAALQAAEESKARAGRAEQSRDEERARADRADAALTAERARADALRDRVEAAELAKRQAEEAAELARSQATHAHKSVAEQRQAETDRKARGLLARLRAAVRGE